MNFSEEVKRELVNIFDEPCCAVAGLSAYIKGVGTLERRRGELGFVLVSESPQILGKYAQHLKSLYGEEPYNVSFEPNVKLEYSSTFKTARPKVIPGSSQHLGVS